MMRTESNRLNQFLTENYQCTINYLRKNFSKLNDEDCEDVFQEAAMALYQNISNGRYQAGTATLYTYFLRIVINKAQNHVRDMPHTDPFDDTQNDVDNSTLYSNDLLEELIGMNEDNERQRDRLQTTVRTITQSLNGKCNDLLWGHYGDNLSWETLADMYELANANVAKSTANRCRHQFRDRFNQIRDRIVYG